MFGNLPDFSFESAALASGKTCIVGVDEAGRGPLAGPVVAAAVCLDATCIPEGLNDSKRLTAAARSEIAACLWRTAEVAVGIADVEEIDSLNILHASMLAMERAVVGLRRAADHVLVDGNRVPSALSGRAACIVGGDALCLSISAASVIAKVWRDRLMVDLAQHHPGYGWERNVGYPTKEHQEALRNLGVTPHHRRSFRPVHNILYQEKSLSD